MPMIPHRLLVATALGLCLAVAGSPVLGAEHTFDGIYLGKRVLTKGTANENCPAEENVSVTIHGGTLTFTNSVLKITLCRFILKRTDHSVRLILMREATLRIIMVA